MYLIFLHAFAQSTRCGEMAPGSRSLQCHSLPESSRSLRSSKHSAEATENLAGSWRQVGRRSGIAVQSLRRGRREG